MKIAARTDDAPAPILAPDLRQSFADAVKAIPDGKKFQAGVAVTNRGVQAEAGYKPKSWLDLSAYAGRSWGAPGGWTTGARVTISK